MALLRYIWWMGKALCQLLKELKLGIKVKLVEDVEVHSNFFSSI
jgi:hypothetical protein